MSEHMIEIVEKGREDLEAFNAAKTQRGLTILPQNANQFALSNHCNRLPSAAYAPVSGEKSVSVVSMAVLYSKLSSYYDNSPTFGYAYPSKDTLMDLTGLKEKTLRTAIRGLRDAGLIGLIPGIKKGVTSKYYFLIHTGSRMAFEIALQVIANKNDTDFDLSMGTPETTPF